MKYFYKIGPSSINYDSTKREIILRDAHDTVKIAQAPFERIIKTWKDGSLTFWNARGTAPGGRLYDEGIIIEYYDEDVLSFVWLPEDDWEAIIQAYNKFARPVNEIESYGLLLPNNDFAWKGFIPLSCSASTMKMLCAAPRNFTKLTIDDWTFEQRDGMVAGCHNQKNSLQWPTDVFFATLDYWQKETQN